MEVNIYISLCTEKFVTENWLTHLHHCGSQLSSLYKAVVSAFDNEAWSPQGRLSAWKDPEQDRIHRHQLEPQEDRLKPVPILVTSDIGDKAILKKLGSVS